MQTQLTCRGSRWSCWRRSRWAGWWHCSGLAGSGWSQRHRSVPWCLEGGWNCPACQRGSMGSSRRWKLGRRELLAPSWPHLKHHSWLAMADWNFNWDVLWRKSSLRNTGLGMLLWTVWCVGTGLSSLLKYVYGYAHILETPFLSWDFLDPLYLEKRL